MWQENGDKGMNAPPVLQSLFSSTFAELSSVSGELIPTSISNSCSRARVLPVRDTLGDHDNGGLLGVTGVKV
jgi:hypothetical protein